MKIVGIIPARLASVRFDRKILKIFHGLPMIEHVRRRAILSELKDNVYVATCDEEIEEVIQQNNGKVIKTGSHHKNGTTRVSEAIEKISCSHVVLLQGDEPLLLPQHVNSVIKAMEDNPSRLSWNATGELENESELDRHSFVKCMISKNNDILTCFRRSPCFSEFTTQKLFIRKLLGIIGYKKQFLLDITKQGTSTIEDAESIEQMRIIENGFKLTSVPVYPSLPSVNEPHEVSIINDYLKNNLKQQELLRAIQY